MQYNIKSKQTIEKYERITKPELRESRKRCRVRRRNAVTTVSKKKKDRDGPKTKSIYRPIDLLISPVICRLCKIIIPTSTSTQF